MPKNRKQGGYVEKYDLFWEQLVNPIEIELEMIRHGGEWKTRQGKTVGNGMFFHFKQLQTLLWPEEDWHRWRDLTLKTFLENRVIGVLGPASSAKTHDAALFALCVYYAFPACCTALCCSTEREMLEKRIWGEIKTHHKRARASYEGLPGQLTESKQIIMTDERFEFIDGRDVKNSICGVPCKKGGNYVGLSSYIGVKNKIVLLVADEGQFLPRAFIDAISNLNKNQDSRGIPKELAGLKVIVLGNPKDITDSLGIVCEPSAAVGGWDGGIDQSGPTKTWPTRFDGGVALQLVGSDCPNMDVPEDVPPPFPYLITRKAIQQDIQFYGQDSVQYTMMNEGRFPRGEGSRRVITRAMCLKFKAMESPVWKDETRVRIGGLDAAYSGIGGDRTIFTELQFGPDVEDKQILAMITSILVPVTYDNPDIPEDQIAKFVMEQCKTRNIPPENLFFDSTGRGSLALALARLWSPNVIGIEFGGKPSDRQVSSQIPVKAHDYFSKKVSELWFAVRHSILSGQFRGLAEEVMMEGIYKEWRIAGANKTEVETKADTKIKSGRSSDLFDSLIVAVEGARQRGFVISSNISKASTALTSSFKERIEEKLGKLRKSYELTYS